MSTISSLAAYTTTLAEQLTGIADSTRSSLVDYLNSSGDSLTESLLNVAADNYSLSAISQSLNAVAKSAKESDVDDNEALNNVRLFALDMKSKGYDTVSIMKYLAMARNLAKRDPEKFTELFSSSDKTDTPATIATLNSDGNEKTAA